ncbi:MAG: fumarylacetoacetate hydrolase family protein [Candidatus Bathyarchaeota archaeon]|jgi:2-keto-4-pentenoate hydratase/2-oxohepta-3-ene-1,7-dioic acid hydratase in catechol pathway|nr:fumarylacetoacetate hydrolase family protein [Candidatus Bathyarchaeota archaeon]
MKLVRYRHKKGEDYGALIGDKIICLPKLAKLVKEKLPKRLGEFVTLGVEGIEKAEKLIETANENNIKHVSFLIDEITLLAPINFPPKIICLGLNYRNHAAEQNAPIPDEPIIFLKPHTAIIGPSEKIVKPSFVNQLDYEAELAVVMGKKAKNVGVSEAKSYIFGYTIMNDVSARDIQFKDKQWTRGKSFDTFAPMGPCITTTNQIEDTTNLSIRTWVNGELRQNSTTKNMVFTVEEIIHHLSRVMTLEPCDIIATGTPAGVGFATKPQPKFLQAGDVVRIEIERIGVLENMVVEEKF